MFIHHEDVLLFMQGDLSDPAWCLQVIERIKPGSTAGWKPSEDPLSRHPCTLLISYLKQLPPLERTQKIGNKAHEIAARHGSEILRLRWWDVETSKRHLEVLLRRRMAGVAQATGQTVTKKTDMREVVALLMWKKSEGANNEPRRYTGASSTRPSWAFDKSAPGGWRFEIECEIFEHIKDAFDGWLASPLPPLPHHHT